MSSHSSNQPGPEPTSAAGAGPARSTRRRGVLRTELRESFLMAMAALSAHKLRSALTLLGVLVGVFSIIIVMTTIRALQSNVETQLSRLGANTFQINKWPGAFFGPGDFEKYWRRKNITYDQFKQVRERATLARSVGVESDFWGGQAISRYAETPPNIRLTGVSPGVFTARGWDIAEGRPVVESDLESARSICVLGSDLAETLFPFGSAMGENVKFDGINYSVIGVLAARGSVFGANQDNFALIPITTGLDRYGRTWRSLSILVQAPDQTRYQDSIEQVRGVLRAVRKVEPGADDDFEVFSNESLIRQFAAFTLSVRIGAAVISSIALLAAGIGIMNIMLVSVTERTREIGIRRAVGARKRNITVQFILEAIVLCEVGGLIGVLFGVAGGNLAAFYFEVPAVIPVDWIILGLAICSVVGIVFGTYPAVKAANLDPVESLRYE